MTTRPACSATISLEIEPCIYNMAGRLSADYNGGYWDMFDLEPGFLMVPPQGQYRVQAENGADVTLGAEAFGLTVCLYTYSLLSFRLEACSFALRLPPDGPSRFRPCLWLVFMFLLS